VKRTHLTQLVAEISKTVRKVQPQALISAAGLMPYNHTFYGNYTQEDCRLLKNWRAYWDAYNFLCADWVSWLKKGDIDFACPMLYFLQEDMNCFRLEVKEVAQIISYTGKPVYAGLGFEWSNGIRKNSPETIRQQIQICMEKGLPGVVIFSHSWQKKKKNHWKVLQEESS